MERTTSMAIRIRARYDGETFVPKEDVELPKDTDVTLTVVEEEEWEPEEGRYLFLKAARAANLQGPEDWSTKLDDYLYGGKTVPDLEDE